MEAGIVFNVSSVNLDANNISAPSIAIRLAIAGALPPIANLALGICLAELVSSENSVAFSTYLLKCLKNV